MKEDDFKSGDRRDGGRPTSGRRDDARSANAPRPRRDDRPGDSTDDRRSGSEPRRDAGARPFNRDSSTDRPRPYANRERDTDRRADDRRSDARRDDARPRPSFDRDRNSASRPDRSDTPRFGNSGPGNRREEYPKPQFNRDDRPRSSNQRGDYKGDNDRPRYADSRRDAEPRDAAPRDTHSASRFTGARSDSPRDNEPNDRDTNRRDSRRDDRFGSNDRFSSERSEPSREERQRSGENRFGQERRYEERPKPNRPVESRDNDARPTDRRDAGTPAAGRQDERPERYSSSRDASTRRPYDDRSTERTSNSPDKYARNNDRPSSFDRNDRPERPTRRFDNPADNRRGGSDQSRSDRRERPAPRQDDRRSGPSSEERRVGRYDRAPKYDFDAMRNDIPRKKRDELDRTEKHDNRNTEGTIRLNRYIANAGICSRREADELIAQGTVQVNGKVVTEMGHKVQPGDVVKYGNRILNPEKMVYVLLNKPKDYITTTEDPEERRTVMELVADAGPFRIYPVGRLDRNTTGLMLMTNDGELAEKLTHPSNEIKKVYQVELDKPITNEDFEAIQAGIELEDGVIKPDALSIVTPDAQVVGIEIHSGRNRIVRRIFENFGYEVTKLDRTSYAGLTKKELPRGSWRFLEPKEVIKLKYLQ